MNTNEKLAEIFENEQFKLEVQNVETPEDFQALLAEYGVEMTLEEVEQFCEQVAVCMQQGELSEEEMEDVAGGVPWVLVAAAVGLCAGFCAGYKSTRKKKR